MGRNKKLDCEKKIKVSVSLNKEIYYKIKKTKKFQ